MKKANRGNFGTCAKCRQQILWIKTINGKNMPVNARLITYRVKRGNCTAWDAGCHRRRVHFTFCHLPGC